MNLAEDQKALVVWDVFRGQMTEKVKDRLAAIDVVLIPVPANMTQPLDLTVNGSAKVSALLLYRILCSSCQVNHFLLIHVNIHVHVHVHIHFLPVHVIIHVCRITGHTLFTICT